MIGRTMAMVKALPASGAVVVVHSGVMRDYVRRMIYNVRGREVFDRCAVVILGRSCAGLRSERRPIFADHALPMYADIRAVDELYLIIKSRNDRLTPA